MKETARYGFILALICALAAGLLAGVNALTKSRIIAQSLGGERAALKEIMPEGVNFEAVISAGKTDYYKVFNQEGIFLGLIFKASAKGYSSTIEVLAGISKDAKITAIKVVSASETPGLGSKINGPDFINQFRGTDTGLSGVQAITGATISSRAVISAVKKRAEELKDIIKNDK